MRISRETSIAWEWTFASQSLVAVAGPHGEVGGKAIRAPRGGHAALGAPPLKENCIWTGRHLLSRDSESGKRAHDC